MQNNVDDKLEDVLNNYEIVVKNVQVETLKGKKAVWWVNTDKGKYVLKKVPVVKDRLLFLLSAIQHLRNNGVKIPEIEVTAAGQLFVENEENIFILMKAIIGKPPRYTVPSEMDRIMQGMALFHKASKDFTPPPEAKVRSHLDKWEKIYNELVADLEKYKEQALACQEKPFEQFYLEHCDCFIEEGKACLRDLHEPAYAEWVAKVKREINLCHQDFAAGNLGLIGDTIYVYDMDSITFDLPARDIRKIFNKVMKQQGQWDVDLTTKMLSSYQQINPLSADEIKVLFIDIKFPHLFHGIASKYFENREHEWSFEKYLHRLKEMTKVEKSKEIILKKQEDIINLILSTGNTC